MVLNDVKEPLDRDSMTPRVNSKKTPNFRFFPSSKEVDLETLGSDRSRSHSSKVLT